MRKERRREPRLRVRVPVKLVTKGVDRSIDARTLDLSYNGAYCCVARFIPLNSKVDVELGLPGSSVLCKGIVVRNKKGRGKDRFDIALFFSDISATGKQRIVEFIDGRLGEEGITNRALKKRVKPFVEKESHVSRKKGLEISSARFRVLKGEIIINSKGLSCRTDRKVPLFNEVAVNIVLPSQRRTTDYAIQCNGIVVSCDKIRGSNSYDLTLYFVGLSQREMAKIDSFIASGKSPKSSLRK